ncbi:G-protein coupled receptor 20 [Electrophorus electricus]|uniref:G-protein coupled receptor 20 n=1 Tax=Electrophorus electricus TaxID=8005 RepID=UPI0015D0BC3A|nr:G-protein coupled receptor 20 [Electrophorus electricus]
METILREFFNITPDPPVNTSHRLWGVPYLKRLAHLDDVLYQDFHVLWVSLTVVNSLMFAVGLVLNSLALYVFCMGTKSRTAPVIYTINLAVADLLVALSLPARIALYYSGGACEACSYVHTFSYFVNMYCSVLFLTSICVDRYMAVVWAAGTAARCRSPAAARAVSAAVWLFAVVVTYSFQTTALEFGGSACCRLPALFALTVLEFLLPLLVIVGFTARVACALAAGALMPQSRGRRARAVRLLLAVLAVFTVCFTPFHVREAVLYFHLGGSTEQHVVAYHATVTLSSLNSCLDPVVYCFVPDNFRSALRRAFRGRAARQGGAGGAVVFVPSARRSSTESGSAVAFACGVAALALSPCALPPQELPAWKREAARGRGGGGGGGGEKAGPESPDVH